MLDSVIVFHKLLHFFQRILKQLITILVHIMIEINLNCCINIFSYMVSAVQYGGRVTDDYDNRLLVTFTRVWLSEQLFSDDFQFYKGYGIMKFKNIPEYLEEIEKMKTVDPPQAYGLHSNADITLVTSLPTVFFDLKSNIKTAIRVWGTNPN